MNTEKRQAYQEKAEAQLREWNAKIKQLVAEAEEAKADTKIEMLERVEELRAKRDTAQERLDELREASEEKWQEIRDKLETAKDELGEGIERAYATVTQG
jgi:uncharacterized coiled-coil DUF342 family protein